MEPLKRILAVLNNEPVTTLKYLLITAGFFTTFVNLFDCIISSAPLHEYLFYVGFPGVGTALLTIIKSNTYLCFILSVFGMISIFDTAPNTIAGGIVLVLFAKRISNNIPFSIGIYAVTLMMVAANSIFLNATPSDALNVSVAYFTIYFIDYLLYNIKRGV